MKKCGFIIIVYALACITVTWFQVMYYHYGQYIEFNIFTIKPVYIMKLYDVYIEGKFYYQSDKNGDYAKTPEEFERDGGGDCEDFAIYFAYIIQKYTNERNIYIVGIERHALIKVGLFHYDYGELKPFLRFTAKDYCKKDYFIFMRTLYEKNIKDTNKIFSSKWR